jgi:hypothetical protein
MKKLCAAFGLLLALTACETQQAPPPAHTSAAPPPKIALDVQVINLADRSGQQPVSSPYNSNRFSPTIADAIKQWASDRLQAAGQSGQAIIVIKDASLIAQPMPIKEGIDGWFTRQQGVKYIGRAEVSIEANGRPGFSMADAVATRAVTLPENPTPIEKQDAYYTMLNGLMKDLGQNLETGIQTHMGSFIVSQQVYGVTAVPTGSDLYAGAPQDGEGPVIIQSPVAPPQYGQPYGNPQQYAGHPYNNQQQYGQQQYSGQQYGNQPYGGQPYGGQPYNGQQYNPQMGGMNSAVAEAALPSPPQVAVSPPTMTISQASQGPGPQYGSPNLTMSASGPPISVYQQPSYQPSAPMAPVTQMPLPPPQAPVFNNADTGSAPGPYSQQASGYAPAQQPSGGYGGYDNYSNYNNSYANAPQQQPAPPSYNAPNYAPVAPQQQPPQQNYASANAPPQQPGPSAYGSYAPPLPQPSYNNYGNTYAAAAPQQPAQMPRGEPATIPLSAPPYYGSGYYAR